MLQSDNRPDKRRSLFRRPGPMSAFRLARNGEAIEWLELGEKIVEFDALVTRAATGGGAD